MSGGQAEAAMVGLGPTSTRSTPPCATTSTQPRRSPKWRPRRETNSLTDAELGALAREFDAVLGVGLTDLGSVDLDLKRTGVEISDAGTDPLGRQRRPPDRSDCTPERDETTTSDNSPAPAPRGR